MGPMYIETPYQVFISNINNFKSKKKKKKNIIIGRVISSHMGLICIETSFQVFISNTNKFKSKTKKRTQHYWVISSHIGPHEYWDLPLQTDHITLARRSELVLINKKKK